MVKPSRFITELEPYKTTPQDVWSAGAPKDLLKLDWNESPFDFDFYQDELSRIANERGMIAWYPDYLALELSNELSQFTAVDANLILTFPGSDVGLETLCRTYLEPNDKVLALCPTYENFFVYVLQTGARLETIDIIPPFIPDMAAIASHIEELGPAKAVYISRPNNPFGYMVSRDAIAELAARCPETMIIVDEAYIEFSDEPSCASLVERLPNIVVTRTFSKAFGMAGLRLGYICGSLDVINNVNKIRNGKNISMLSQRLGLHALRNYKKVAEWIAEVKVSRVRFGDWCSNSGLTCYPSHGNFILFKVSHPNELCSALKAEGIYVRNRSSLLPGCVRVTLGSSRHVERLIASLCKLHEYL
jgi:histidinol-phosphate aminotransferase